MPQLRAFLLRLAGIFQRQAAEEELNEEIESNLRFHIEDNIQAGMTPAQARRAALVKFGSVTAAKEAWRERRRLPLSARYSPKNSFPTAIRLAAIFDGKTYPCKL